MLTARQLADMQADVDAVKTSGTLDNSLVLMARHTQYLLDEVTRLTETDKDRWERDETNTQATP